MSDSRARSSLRRIVWYWPWAVLALTIATAVWHALDFPSDVDPEAPTVYRPTFSRLAPAAYRLAETGDTIDWMAIDFAAAAILLAGLGLYEHRKARPGWGLWPAALALAVAAFWHASTPGPSVDGWWGFGWRSIFDSSGRFSLDSPCWRRPWDYWPSSR